MVEYKTAPLKIEEQFSLYSEVLQHLPIAIIFKRHIHLTHVSL